MSFGPGEPLSEEVLKRMGETIRYRGPDDEGYFRSGPMVMGMRRLSVIDLKGGKQPMFSADGKIAVVFNGEIYNYKEIRTDLDRRFCRFGTNSDTEVILRLYEEKGIEHLVKELRGMFAIAIWDGRTRKLYLVRDRLGKKPLAYSVSRGGITFASEIKAVLADPAVPRDLDLASLDLYFAMQFIPHPYSAFKSVQKLPPAHYLEISEDGKMDLVRYWTLNFTSKTRMDPAETAEDLKKLLLESTRLRLNADVPLGLLLSGGLDSAAVASALAECHSGPFKTFSVGFEGDPESELPMAESVAHWFGTDHHPIIVNPDIKDLLPKLAGHFDEPFGDSSAVPTFVVAREARKHVTVVLNGDGGDEAFAGYPRYGGLFHLATAYMNPESVLGRVWVEWLLAGPPRLREFPLKHLRKWFIPAHRGVFQPEALSISERAALYTDDFRKSVSADRWTFLLDLVRQALRESTTVAESILHVDMNLYLPADLLVKMDMMTMANSLEARSPFLDHKLLEFCASLPMDWKVRGGMHKWILRQAVGDRLPLDLLSRPKRGFGLPLRAWIRGDLQPMIRELLLENPQGLPQCFNLSRLRPWIERALARPRGDEKKIWSLLVFELWYRSLAR